MELIDQIINRNVKKYNRNIVIVGPTGIGKSYAALRMLEAYYNRLEERDLGKKPENLTDHIVFTPEHFLDLVNTLPQRSTIVFDEVGLSYDSASWYSSVNKLLTHCLESYRYKVINVIFTIPHLGLMDKKGLSLVHGIVNIRTRGYGIVYRINFNPLMGKRFQPRWGTLQISLPSNELCTEYDEIKKQYMDLEMENYAKELKVESRDKELHLLDDRTIIRNIVADSEKFRDKSRGEIDAALIAHECGITNMQRAYKIRKVIKSKHPDIFKLPKTPA